MTNKQMFVFAIVITCLCSIGFGIQLISSSSEQKNDISSQKEKFPINESVFAGKPLLNSETHSQTDPDTNFNQDYESRYGKRPKSLRGTQVDGELVIDSSGKLVVSIGIRSVFDYFLSTAGEEPMETIIGRIEEYVRQVLPAEAADDALRILDSYLLYKQGLHALVPNSPKLENDDTFSMSHISEIGNHLERRREMRQKYMQPDVVATFFGEEEIYEQFTLQRLELELNETLTQEEKEIKTSQLAQQFPEHTTENWHKDRKRQELNQTINELQKQGDASDEIYELRATAFGEAAADRYAVLDEKRAGWQSRIDAYRTARRAVMDAPDLTYEEKLEAVDKLGQDSFSERELMRVNVIEKMQALITIP